MKTLPDGTALVDADQTWIDRRALERAGWRLEDPDQYRGEPFERMIHKGGDDIREIVYVPVGVHTKSWATKTWQRSYPNLYAWFLDDADFRAARWGWIVFIKSDF